MTAEFPETLPALLRRAGSDFGDRPAITSREGLRTHTISYRDLHAAAGAVAEELVEQFGLARGQRVILLAPSGVRTVAALFGLFRAGLIAVPLDLNSSPTFIESVSRTTEAVAIVAAKGMHVPDGLRQIILEDLPLSSGPDLVLPEPEPEDIAEIVFTSGTTGTPKGVTLSHRNIISDVQAASGVVPPGEEMSLVSILPLSHMFEQTVGLFLPLTKGGCVHYAPSLKPSAIVGEIRRRRVTGMVVVPRFLALMMSAAEDRVRERRLDRLWDAQHRIAAGIPMGFRRLIFWPFHRDLGGRLRFFLCGGAALSPDLMRAWERIGIRVLEGYGSTECAPVIASNAFDDRVPGTIGRPLAGVSVRLSEGGELQVRGPNVFSQYWRSPSLTEAAFTSDGWYRSGDIAEVMADGRFRIVGRLSERIVLPSGMNVYPADVEARLTQEHEILECVVLGLKEERGGEQLHALIRPEECVDEMAVAKALDRANSALASHQRVTGFTIWTDEFPKTALLKVKRKELKKVLDDRSGVAAQSSVIDPVGLAGVLLRRVVTTPSAEITPEMRLDLDLGLDSLGRVALAAQIEQETGREVPEETVAALTTAGELAVLLAKPGSGATAMPFASWPRWPSVALLRLVLQQLFLFLPHRVFARPFRAEGYDALASAGQPVLLIANHSSHADTLAILRALPVRLRARTAVAAAADYFFANRWVGVFAAILLGAFPFSREGRVRQSLENCGKLTDGGWSILIYPEGTRSPDGRLLPFKAGIGLLATGLGVPVVPIVVTGGVDLLRKGSIWPRRSAVSVRFGVPMKVLPGMSPAEATAMLQRRVEDLISETQMC